jgi:hypothetical protein
MVSLRATTLPLHVRSRCGGLAEISAAYITTGQLAIEVLTFE